MRDPMSWSVPFFRAYGIQVKVHIFFFVVTLGLFWRQLMLPQYDRVWWLDMFLLSIVVLFGSVLLHEFGHCFGARYAGGEAREILIWPLGGLAMVEVPHRWKALFVMVAAGPAVNVLICLTCALALVSGGFFPSLNPFTDPHRTEMTNFRDDQHGRTFTSPYAVKLYKPGTNEEPSTKELLDAMRKYEATHNERLPKATDTEKY